MGLAWFIVIGKEQRVVLLVQRIDLYPAGEGEGGVAAIQIDAYAVARPFEFQGIFTGPASLRPLGSDRAAGALLVERCGEVTHETVPAVIGRVLEVVERDEAGIIADSGRPRFPLLQTAFLTLADDILHFADREEVLR